MRMAVSLLEMNGRGDILPPSAPPGASEKKAARLLPGKRWRPPVLWPAAGLGGLEDRWVRRRD
ncbi:hypothetical protein GCM10012319_36500 [Comamonas sp. KCTC 72670]|nr:hypothetical protein GCM10012319_36500 [Comamonas sp. KCTC 72670]